MIDHVNAYALSVKDLEKCVSFYGDKLGFKLESKEDDFAYFVFNEQGGPSLALVAVESAARMISEEHIRPREDTIRPKYFAVFVDNVDREYEDLKSKGVHFVTHPPHILGDRESATSKTGRKPFGNISFLKK